MPHVATTPADLLQTIRPAAHLDGDLLVIDDEPAFRSAAIRDLAWTAAFSTDEATTAAAQWLVWEASQALGAHSASIQDLYTARGRGEVSGFTVPAINLRAQTFDMARTVFETAMGADVGAVILEIAPASRPTPTSGPSTTRLPCSPARSPPAGGHPSSSRVTITSSTPGSTRPTRRR
jgi:hypothetical protein